MTAPQHPHLPTQQKRRSTADIVATVVLLLIAATAGVLSLCFSMFFAMAADPCGSINCNTGAIGWAYGVTWGGVGIAAVIAIGGTFIGAARHRIMWVWPTVALVLIVAAVGIAMVLLNSVVPHH